MGWVAQLEDLSPFTLLFVAQYGSHQTGPQKTAKILWEDKQRKAFGCAMC